MSANGGQISLEAWTSGCIQFGDIKTPFWAKAGALPGGWISTLSKPNAEPHTYGCIDVVDVDHTDTLVRHTGACAAHGRPCATEGHPHKGAPLSLILYLHLAERTIRQNVCRAE